MEILVDSHRCQGTAMCVAVAPDLFAIRPDGIAEVLVGEVPDDSVADARDAVQACPAAALLLAADGR